METFLFYLLRSSLVAILLYGIYMAIFSKTTFHRANRIALDSILAVSVVFPLFRFRLIPETAHSMMDISAINGSNLSELPVSSVGQSLWQNIPWIEIIAIFYFAGLSFFLIRQLLGFMRLAAMIRTSEKEAVSHAALLCITDCKIQPFSWFRYIVVSKDDVKSNYFPVILWHESTHVERYHSVDRTIFDLFACIFWFNPFAWQLRREIQTVHEYQADEHTLESGVDIKQYQLLLIRKSAGENTFALANNFLQRDLHKRIRMMKTIHTNISRKWQYALMLPGIAISLIALSIPALYAKADSTNTSKQQIPSGTANFLAHKSGEKETVVQDTTKVTVWNKKQKVIEELSDDAKRAIFIVDGTRMNYDKVQVIDPQEIDNVSVLKGDAATSVYGTEAKDGVVIITTKNNGHPSSTERRISVTDGNPLILMNGVAITKEEMDKINPDEIESVNVLKGEQATRLYGEKGKNGVVIITPKGEKAVVPLREGMNKENPPLIVIDGKRMPKDFNLSTLKSEEIESISVLKDKSAVETYGEDGKNGVIVILKK
ncbi:M56 family metallopeptidase [Seramator thermalis]|uniref:M56 family metallopeptidase n=1 Tax=Seramator thermalis TaxID=2496270 RepID=UPI0013EA9B00|nr:M56 family metallopeptidase [Seramator thermalis]